MTQQKQIKVNKKIRGKLRYTCPKRNEIYEAIKYPDNKSGK